MPMSAEAHTEARLRINPRFSRETNPESSANRNLLTHMSRGVCTCGLSVLPSH
jgi:hypothetical protein